MLADFPAGEYYPTSDLQGLLTQWLEDVLPLAGDPIASDLQALLICPTPKAAVAGPKSSNLRRLLIYCLENVIPYPGP